MDTRSGPVHSDVFPVCIGYGHTRTVLSHLNYAESTAVNSLDNWFPARAAAGTLLVWSSRPRPTSIVSRARGTGGARETTKTRPSRRPPSRARNDNRRDRRRRNARSAVLIYDIVSFFFFLLFSPLPRWSVRVTVITLLLRRVHRGIPGYAPIVQKIKIDPTPARVRTIYNTGGK